ncbi:MAG: NUDIX hydrolase [Candidatus Sungiibacteriota bacterium]
MKKGTKRKGQFKLLSTREVYKNPWIRVREDKVIRPGGKNGVFAVIEMKDGSSVLALTVDNKAYLIKEYKYGIGKESIELMSGALEESETPLDAAKRELKEELGLEAMKWIPLGVINPFTTIVHSPNYLFLALGVHRQGIRSPDDGEILHSMKVPFAKAVAMVMKGKITHGASCVLILKAEKYLNDKSQ